MGGQKCLCVCWCRVTSGERRVGRNFGMKNLEVCVGVGKCMPN